MKKILLIVLLAVGFVYLCTGCRREQTAAPLKLPEEPGEPVDVFQLTIREVGRSSWARVLEVERVDDGVCLRWKQEELGSGTVRIIREVSFGEDVLAELQTRMGAYHVPLWDGFVGENPPDVLDGSTVEICCTLADGREIRAEGSNNFPPGYQALNGWLMELVQRCPIGSVDFSAEQFSAVLPESWIGQVDAWFGEDHIAFVMETEQGTAQLIRLDLSRYGWDQREWSMPVGILTGPEETIWLSLYTYPENDTVFDTQSRQTLVRSLETDKLAIARSILGDNGYTFLPATGR